MVINAEKTKYMIFHTKNRKIDMQNLEVFFNFNDVGSIENPSLKFNLTSNLQAEQNRQIFIYSK
jgi:hypothetical protein